jgi:CubicO group peptidase (beta-lactamase class C family)
MPRALPPPQLTFMFAISMFNTRLRCKNIQSLRMAQYFSYLSDPPLILHLKSSGLHILTSILMAAIILLQPLAGEVVLDSREVSQRANAWIQAFAESRDFSGLILLAQRDRVIYEKTYGSADFQHNVPVSPDTIFRVASLSKTFTAAAIEMLLRENKLKLSDPLSAYVRGIPNGDEITVKHLLLHQSGVARFDPMVRECRDNEALIQRLRDSKPPFFSR